MSKTSGFTSALKESALGISTAASSVTSLHFQYDNLEKSQTRVDNAERTLTSAQASLIAAQQAVNKLNQEGITSGADYEKALLKSPRKTASLYPLTVFHKHKATSHKHR